MNDIPLTGHDIIIKKGAWIGSNCTIIGPCIIGENAVIAAGSVVVKRCEGWVIVGGIPNKLIKHITLE